MWEIDPNTLKIRMTRGDTPSFKLNLTTVDDDGNESPYIPFEGDKIIFALRKNANDDALWAIVEVPTDTMVLRFKQETTKALSFGNYIYEISLNNDEQDFHDTFIYSRPFELLEELY